MKFSLLMVGVLASFQILAGPGNEAVNYLDKALKSNVTTSGVVNYKALKFDANFKKSVELYQNLTPESTWTRNEKMAYWINIYNVFTIQLILNNYPLTSINEIDQPWDQKFIHIGDDVYSLNQIEHEILRPKFKDPRVHFAVNCASFSCPKLHNKAFRAETLEEELNTLTKIFLNDTKRNVLKKNELKLSQIFSWFKDDFTNGRTLIEFINQYSIEEINSNASISFLDYNWNLNE